MINYVEKTLEYYSMWLGQERVLNQDINDVNFIYFKERNETQYGYGQPFDIYIFCYEDKRIISYGDKAKEKLKKFKNGINQGDSVEKIKTLLQDIYKKDVYHNIKYVFNELPTNNSVARVLDYCDYGTYEDFFKKCNPNCKNVDWLKEYFEEMVQEHICVGVLDGDILVSCTDAPGMPYMSNEVQEVGINTLQECRGKGYAMDACMKCIEEILKNGKVPQWSTDVNNIASQKLAEKVGFVKLADVITVTL